MRISQSLRATLTSPTSIILSRQLYLTPNVNVDVASHTYTQCYTFARAPGPHICMRMMGSCVCFALQLQFMSTSTAAAAVYRCHSTCSWARAPTRTAGTSGKLALPAISHSAMYR